MAGFCSRRDRAQFFFLSHFHAAAIDIEGEVWPTVEHSFQSRKSLNPEFRAAIRACGHPGMAKRLGAAPEGPRRFSADSWFRTHSNRHRPDWREIRLGLMRAADEAKFSQHPELAALLRATECATIIEDSPVDEFWGTGATGEGENWAGRILMEVRNDVFQRRQCSSDPRPRHNPCGL